MSAEPKQWEDPAPHLRRILAPYADDYAAAAESAEDLATADAAEVLAAIANGERPPVGAVQRIVERAQEDA